jgi:hypothetical protein
LYDSQNNFAPFANNQVPINNPVAQFLFFHPEAYPLPNQAPTDGIAQNNYKSYQNSFNANNQGDLRIDYTIGPRDTLMGRYSMGDAYDGVSHSVLPVSFPAADDDYLIHSIVLNWTHVFSDLVVNELRVSFTRLAYGNSKIQDPTGLFGVTGNAKVGIPGEQTYVGFSEQAMTTGTISAVGTTAGIYGKRDNNFIYADNLTWQHGNHVSKFGVQFIRYQQNNFYPGNEGTLAFSTTAASSPAIRR